MSKDEPQEIDLFSLVVCFHISDHVMPRLGGDSFMCKYLNKRTFLKGMTCDLKWAVCIQR